mgnify:CR=1 FL=1
MKKGFYSAVFATACLVTLFTSCEKKSDGVPAQKDDKVLYLYNWTYYTPDEVLRNFEAESVVL